MYIYRIWMIKNISAVFKLSGDAFIDSAHHWNSKGNFNRLISQTKNVQSITLKSVGSLLFPSSKIRGVFNIRGKIPSVESTPACCTRFLYRRFCTLQYFSYWFPCEDFKIIFCKIYISRKGYITCGNGKQLHTGYSN